MTAKSRIPVDVPATRALSSLGGAVATVLLVFSPGPASARPALPARSSTHLASALPGSPATLAPMLEQHSRRGSSGSGGGGGQAVPRGGSGGGSGSGGGTAGGGGTRSGGSSGGGDARTRSGSGGDSGRASGGGDTTYSRPRGDRPATGTAVERRDGDRPPTVIVDRGGYYGGFYPWGWGGLGLGGYYGYYDPWGWGWYDPYPPGGYASGYGGYDGALKLKVKPRQAEVFVDGYFAGSVDDYDGIFQQLRLEPGPHRIEVRLDGYEPLSFEVRIIPDRTITYKGDLEQAEP